MCLVDLGKRKLFSDGLVDGLADFREEVLVELRLRLALTNHYWDNHWLHLRSVTQWLGNVRTEGLNWWVV